MVDREMSPHDEKRIHAHRPGEGVRGWTVSSDAVSGCCTRGTRGCDHQDPAAQ